MPTYLYPYMLWGYHPRLSGPSGMVPVKLSGGSIRECKTAARRWLADYPGIQLAIYRTGTPPTGLRLQCEAEKQHV